MQMDPECCIKEFGFGKVKPEVSMEGIISRWQGIRLWSSEVRSLEVRWELEMSICTAFTFKGQSEIDKEESVDWEERWGGKRPSVQVGGKGKMTEKESEGNQLSLFETTWRVFAAPKLSTGYPGSLMQLLMVNSSSITQPYFLHSLTGIVLKYPSINLLHANPCLRICFLGNPI